MGIEQGLFDVNGNFIQTIPMDELAIPWQAVELSGLNNLKVSDHCHVCCGAEPSRILIKVSGGSGEDYGNWLAIYEYLQEIYRKQIR